MIYFSSRFLVLFGVASSNEESQEGEEKKCRRGAHTPTVTYRMKSQTASVQCTLTCWMYPSASGPVGSAQEYRISGIIVVSPVEIMKVM